MEKVGFAAHRWDHTAGADAVIKACPVLEAWIIPLMQHVLISRIVRLLVGHPATTLNSYGVTAAKEILHLRGVAAALIVATLEVPVFIKDNLHITDG